MKKRLVLCVAAILLLSSLLWAGLGSHDAMYVGGTVPNLKEKTEGKPVLSDEKAFVFQDSPQGIADAGFVVHDQNARHVVRNQ